MRNDLHIHMILDGVNSRTAIEQHRSCPVDSIIRSRLSAYRDSGVTFLRDGGDAWGVCVRAKELAPEYGIDYRMPAFPIHKAGHYGGFIGRGYSDLKEYASLIHEADTAGADFIKVMISGLMDFNCYGKLSEDSLPADEICELIHIVHDKGLAVMAHCNGAAAALAACDAGVDSIEHGAYLDDEALHAMAETGVIWIPTLSTFANPIGSGRFPDEELQKILSSAADNIKKAARLGMPIGCGSDAGAYRVMHPEVIPASLRKAFVGIQTEEDLLREVLGDATDDILDHAEELVRQRFQRQS